MFGRRKCIFAKKQMVTAFFGADYHMSHTNILKYDKRPFNSIDEHDEEIIANHNAIVGKNHDFYFLGDFCFNKLKTEEYLKRLNGRKFFIKGNHDYHDTVDLYKKYGTYLGYMNEIKLDGQHVMLSHYALRVWNRSHHGSYALYGHSHDKLETDPWGKSMDVGIVSAYRLFGEYRPFRWDEIKTILDARPIKIVDHHV